MAVNPSTLEAPPLRPIIRRCTTRLFQRIRAGESALFHEWSREIVWIIKSETQLVWLHGGEVFQEDSTYGDGHWLLSSVDEAQRMAAHRAAHFRVTADSTLELQLRTRLLASPGFEDEAMRQRNGALAQPWRIDLHPIPDDWRLAGSVCDDAPFGQRLIERSLCELTVWSSKHSPAQNLLAAQDVRQQCLAMAEQADLL